MGIDPVVDPCARDRRGGGSGTTLGPLPRWDMTPFFPSLDSPEFRNAMAGLRAEVEAVRGFFDERKIRPGDPGPVDAALIATFEEATRRLNALYRRFILVRGYVNAFVTTDAADETAQARMSEIRLLIVELQKLEMRYTGWAGRADVDALLAASQVAREHELLLRKASVLARHQLPEGEEELAAELMPAGFGGWVRLHSDVSALLTVEVDLPDGRKSLPMSAVRSLANDPSREVRGAAYEAELAAWETVAVPIAAALNGVKGYQRTLRARRRWADDVEPTLLANSIDRPTLEAMQAACVESFPDFRQYLAAKARALGLEKLAWYDMNAPVGGGGRAFSWSQAESFLVEQFGRYSARMAEFAQRSFAERWTDAEPRKGKEGGAFCMSVQPGVSRVLMNYDGSFNSISTLAHELGHAYHNLNLAAREPLQSRTPSTLAETASIFCETLVYDAVLAGAQGPERVAILENSLQRDLQVVVDIHSRFLFEKAVFERRSERELSAREFSELMLESQRATYGDGLDTGKLHPYMWAVKGHYYGPTFYNYPYTFGLLFGLGLYARYKADPDSFRSGYDEMLSLTGMVDAATLGARFGIDVRSIEFWRSSLDVIRRNIAEFELACGR